MSFNGSVAWSTTKARLSDPDPAYASAELSVSFTEIDWRLLQDVYGWAALQWQGWARGDIYVQSEELKTLAFHSEQVIEFWIDGEHHYGADYYGYGRVPLTLHLEPGVHRVDVRLVRDVRAMGGVGEPSINVSLRLQSSDEWLKPVLLRPGDPYGWVLHSDLADGDYGPMASPYGSVMLRNDAQTDAHILGIDASHNKCKTELVERGDISFVPGQTRPIAFRLACIPPITGRGPVNLNIRYKIDGEHFERTVFFNMWPLTRGLHEPRKVTFLHPAGVVSYAILRAPSPNAHCAPNTSAPVMLALHGAGLEAESNRVRHALDPVPDLCAWVLFPTGGSPWSGDDWHQWGFADVQAAINAIPDWIEQVGWDGVGVDVDRWLVSGHSNGGQGTWYALTHWPDKVIAAAPVAGYSSIQNYVPYTFWHPTDPRKTAVVQAALNSYRHELLLENAAGIAILQQHGSRDENVPAYHSRLLHQLLQQAGAESTYFEMLGKGHWYDNVMTSPPLVDFYRQHLNMQQAVEPSPNIRNFTVVSTNGGEMGSKNGVKISELSVPGQVGKIHVSKDQTTPSCLVETWNVLGFHTSQAFWNCSSVTMDGKNVSASWTDDSPISWSKRSGQWEVAHNTANPTQGSRSGGIDSVLRTHGAFSIIYHSAPAKKIALQISRNLCQYYGADTRITSDYDAARRWNGTRISVIIGAALHDEVPNFKHSIQISENSIQLNHTDGGTRTYTAENGLAAIFLRPVASHQRLELVVWGADEASLAIAARLVPMLPGTGQPDFVVADRRMLWRGVEGTLALGFFDGRWRVSGNSVFE